MTVNMASARKKLDEKNLKILRELVSLPENKHCFDCHQRGPTYVNVTIGSFICTRCSGLLRGLTPPHRVKSISMATFTSEEIELLKCRGNEYCRKVWLSLYDGDSISKDEQQIKEFMIAKYERKRYYVKPSDLEKGKDLTNNSFSFYPQNMSKLPASSVSLTAQSVNNNVNRNYNNNMFSSQEPKEVVKVPDQDPFSAANVNISLNQPIDNFANFDNNPIFDSVSSNFVPVSQDHVSNKSQPPSEDKYAALKDLDCLMKSQTQQSSESSNTSVVEWDSNNIWPQAQSFNQSSAFDASSVTNYKDLNPFTDGNPEVIWNNDSVGNPFNTDFPWASANGQILSTGSTTNQSLHFNPTKPRNSGVTPNPFTVNSIGQNVNHHSNNPFL
ncbi:unnamed protein product [Nezara viridula]|uniref:Arf-GAP domain-containing protein n=1 Tax=Nezara viridula TaxID=85310 RepID=A0A9P0H5J6_NEZVI|nr:unnamed protein product [Nezara viridula]